jgi:hypothetical protein
LLFLPPLLFLSLLPESLLPESLLLESLAPAPLSLPLEVVPPLLADEPSWSASPPVEDPEPVLPDDEPDPVLPEESDPVLPEEPEPALPEPVPEPPLLGGGLLG